MSYRSLSHPLRQRGYTIPELVVTLVLVAIVTTVAYTAFNTTINQYFGLQKNSTQFTDLSRASQRVANVLRGTTDIVSANSNDLTVYAYFFPNNNYVSQIRYYLDATNTILYADVTPMSANPPLGTPLTSQKKTYTIIPSYFKASGVNLFTYLDAGANPLTVPVADEHTIKGIKVTLAVPSDAPTPGGNQTIGLEVSLRNRKTNL